MAITVESKPMFNRVAAMYIMRCAEQEMIGLMRKAIKRMSQQVAESIVSSLDVNVFLKDETDGGKTLSVTTYKKYQFRSVPKKAHRKPDLPAGQELEKGEGK